MNGSDIIEGEVCSGGEPLEENYYYIDDEGNKVGVNIDELEDLENGEEFLLYYARNGELSMVRKLLSSREGGTIELNIDCKGKKKNNHGWTALHLSCYFGHYEVVKILLEHRASVNVINDSGDTPLHKASYVGRLDIVTLLLAHDADVFIKNAEDKTPKDICQDSEILEALLAAECNDMKRKEAQFLRAARDGDLSTVKELLNDLNPVNVNCKDLAGNTALHWASYRNHKEIVVFLLQNGTDPNIRNNSDRIASSLASSVHIKQLLLNVQPVTFNMNIKTLAKCMISRFEGPLARRGKFLVRRNVWAVLERGVLSFFSNLADASTGVKRRGYKYLESAVVKPNSKDENSFTIFFPDNTRTVLAVPQSTGQSSVTSNTSLDRQKWINAITDHIDYATKFLKDGVRVDNDGEDELREILSTQSVQPHINSAQAHLGIFQKHIKALVQLFEEDMAFLRIDSDKAETEPPPSKGFGSYFYGGTSSSAGGGGSSSSSTSKELYKEWKNYWPTLKFHLNILMESGSHTSASLADCIALLAKQDQLRQLFAKRDQEKVRVLEESLRVLARKHHEFEHSLIQSTARRGSRLTFSETDADEYFDAFGDEDDISVIDQPCSESTSTSDSASGIIKLKDNQENPEAINDNQSNQQRLQSLLLPMDDPIKAFNAYLTAADTTIDDILTETLSNSLNKSLTLPSALPMDTQLTETIKAPSSLSSLSSSKAQSSSQTSSVSLTQSNENPPNQLEQLISLSNN
ncbi:oxysterol-binding protein-related protein 1-like [Panonychus citri]|uniref:oxysterol-binding protein-related protein 1-like n=1 Tax=Panonychus citri TaxID=50023 RepID=UPI0023075BBA|nr:oxysterol-binding protein-related protein 1-like [Panonychus citri]